jgi:hypothetical protein
MAGKHRKPHNIPYGKVIEYFSREYGDIIGEAREQFDELVAPLSTSSG